MLPKMQFVDGENRRLKLTDWGVDDYEYDAAGLLGQEFFTLNFHPIDSNHTHLYFSMYGMEEDVEKQLIDMLSLLLFDLHPKVTSSDVDDCRIRIDVDLAIPVNAFHQRLSDAWINPAEDLLMTKKQFHDWLCDF